MSITALRERCAKKCPAQHKIFQFRGGFNLGHLDIKSNIKDESTESTVNHQKRDPTFTLIIWVEIKLSSSLPTPL